MPYVSYKNVESDSVLKRTFKYETQAPTSTVITPPHNTWYSGLTGYDLPTISGTASDLPLAGPGSGGSVNAMQIQVRRGADDTKCWNGATGFNSDCTADPSWISMTASGGQVVVWSTWTYSTTDLWPLALTGESYRVRFRGKDAAKDGTDSAAPNIEGVFELNRNEKNFRVDREPPKSVIVAPGHNVDQSAVTTITGTAKDPDANPAGTGPGKTFVDICKDDGGGNPNTTTGCLAALAGGNFTGPRKYFEATMSGGPTIKNWSLGITGANFVVDTFYHVLVRSSDTVDNLETTAVGAGANTSHHKFKFVGGAATGRIQAPDPLAANQFFTPSGLATVFGTATGDTHVQVLIKDTDTAVYWDGGNWIGVSTWGPHPPLVLSGADWTYSFGAANWRVNHNYTMQVRVCNFDASSCSGTLDQNLGFVVDSSAPVNTITNPNTSDSAYRRGKLGTSSATVADTSDYTDSRRTAFNQPSSLDAASVYFKFIRNKDGKEWSVPLSTFVTPPGTKLYASDQGAGLWTYTTTYFVTDQAWEDGYSYKGQIYSKDKAGNGDGVGVPGNNGLGESPIWRFDASFATASISVPVNTAHINTLSTLRGDVIDPNPRLGDADAAPSGINKVQVYVKDELNQKYFNGTNFGTSIETWFDATLFLNAAQSTGTWSWTHANLNGSFLSGPYSVVARAVDKANNTQYNFGGNGSSKTFTMDKDAPSTVVSAPSDPTYTPLQANTTGVGWINDPLANGPRLEF